MSLLLKWGAYVWTASGAGWAVLAILSYRYGLPVTEESALTSAGCLAMAAVWLRNKDALQQRPEHFRGEDE